MTPLSKLARPALLSLLAVPLAAQEAPDWRLPFRSPDANVAPPEAMWPQLLEMHAIAGKAAPELVSFDQLGVEVVDDPAWVTAREALRQQRFDSGYLSWIIRESRHPGDRAIAMYGMFYEPDPQLVFQMIEHIPGEPLRDIREAAYPRAVEFLRAHLSRRNPGDLEEWRAIRVGPAGQKPPKPGEYSYGFDPVPFFALLALDDPDQHPERDHAQALWFLGQCVELRPRLVAPYLEYGKPALRLLLQSDDAISRDAVKDFVQRCDPEQRPLPENESPEDESTEALLAWFDAVIYTVLPPIREISPGLIDLYPSEDLQRVIELGTEGLADGSLGDTASGETLDGDFYRGLRITATPAPIDKLALPVGTTLTHVNGTAVADSAALLKLLRGLPDSVRSLLVEFVDLDGRRGAREYRLR